MATEQQNLNEFTEEQLFSAANNKLNQHDYPAAEFLYKALLKKTEPTVGIMGNLGLALMHQNKFQEAIPIYQQLLKFTPDDKKVYNNLGLLLYKAGHHAAAEKCWMLAIKLFPKDTFFYNNLGNLLAGLGRKTEALELFTKSLEIDPTNVEALWNRTYCSRYTNTDTPHLTEIKSALKQPNLAQDDKALLYFALGKIYNGAREYKQAFEYCIEANKIQASLLPYDIEGTIEAMQNEMGVYNSDLLEQFRGAGNPSKQPVFIVGMPRSGTTLTEQILSSHPQIHGCGELLYFKNIALELCKRSAATTTPYPYSMKHITPKSLEALASSYLHGIHYSSGTHKNSTYLTDKMPFNFTRLGLIHLLFPNAKIIHCKRNPMDTCVSNFFQFYSTGNEFSYDLETLGKYYRQYHEMMEHWHKVLPNKIYDLQYEDVVADTEGEIRKLLEHLELPWDDACLDFYNTERSVKTASNDQVRQPIYTKSIERWRHYEEFLEPLKKELGDII